MKTGTWLIAFLLSCWTGVVLAQKPVVYTPPEGDFRVLFPVAPAVKPESQGAVGYSASAEGITFSVHRRDPAQQPVDNTGAGIRNRLRGQDGDRVVRQLGEEEVKPAAGEYVFLVDGRASIHRLFTTGGRYYELAVAMPRSELRQGRRIARDFFGSFQVTSAPVAAGALAKLSPEAICKERSNAFFRSFCEYSYCLRSQYREQPFCQNLLRLR